MLSRDWVDRIHARLLARYGSGWIRMWEGINPEAVIADWAEELSGVSAEGIKHALGNLPPDRPPNSAQFKALCFSRPPEVFKAIRAPKEDPEKSAAVRAKLAELAQKLRARPIA